MPSGQAVAGKVESIMNLTIILCLALVLNAALFGCSNQSRTSAKVASTNIANTQLLRVVVIPSTNEVHIKETFRVVLRVENPTITNQTVWVMNCSLRDEWKTSNTNISWIDWDCPKNLPVNVQIPPGGAYTNELEMLVLESLPQKWLAFRMGFTPIGSQTTFWSGAVMVKIKK